MKNYPIYKKRDGQSFNEVAVIYADSFADAKKQFAKQMTDDNHYKSNDVVWMDQKTDGVKVSGWYDFNGGRPLDDEAEDYLMVSESDILDGFDSWSEDVYTWELREPLEFYEICDIEDFENEKGNYSFFMAVENERFFLYNGDFALIAENEGLGKYSDTNDKFMGCQISETEFIETILMSFK